MMIVMQTNLASETGAKVPTMAEALRERDRKVALLFVQKGKGRDARAVIARETGLPLSTVYRAISRELSWAESQEMEEGPGSEQLPDPQHSDSRNPHATNGQVTESATLGATAES